MYLIEAKNSFKKNMRNIYNTKTETQRKALHGKIVSLCNQIDFQSNVNVKINLKLNAQNIQ